MKLTYIFLTGLTVLFMVSVRADVVSSGEPANALSPGDIFKKAGEAYAALTSYTDQGTTVATLNGLTITTNFTIKLARPNLYCIEWVQTNDSAYATTTMKPQSVWSTGDGDFLDMLGQGPKKQKNQEMALAGATGISGGAAATVPGAFFKSNWAISLPFQREMINSRQTRKLET